MSDKISESITDSINSSFEASIKVLVDEHIIPLKQTLKEQQKRIDEQKETISKQAHLVVQHIQKEQHLKYSLNGEKEGNRLFIWHCQQFRSPSRTSGTIFQEDQSQIP